MLWAVLELIPLWRIKSPMCKGAPRGMTFQTRVSLYVKVSDQGSDPLTLMAKIVPSCIMFKFFS